jgi:hypothetical protein
MNRWKDLSVLAHTIPTELAPLLQRQIQANALLDYSEARLFMGSECQ